MKTYQEKRVLWISRHQMTETQKNDLERIAGGKIRLHQWADTVQTVEELRPEIEKADLIAAVLPLELMAKLLKVADGRPVLQAVSKRVATGNLVHLSDGRSELEFRFIHECWQQILRVEVETRRL